MTVATLLDDNYIAHNILGIFWRKSTYPLPARQVGFVRVRADPFTSTLKVIHRCPAYEHRLAKSVIIIGDGSFDVVVADAKGRIREEVSPGRLG